MRLQWHLVLERLQDDKVDIAGSTAELDSVSSNCFKIILYIRILLSKDRFSANYPLYLFSLSPSCLRFVNKCFFHVSRLYRYIYKYFTSSAYWIWQLFIFYFAVCLLMITMFILQRKMTYIL